MFLTIHIILLVFALGSSAHSLSRIQITNGSTIYQIREKPNHIFEIIEPKTKTPTLREIIYFKIKETPYKGTLEKEKLPQEEEPDFDDSERPYTNGPGFQFLDFGPIEVHKSSEDDKDSKNHSNESNNDSSDSNSSESKPDSHETNNGSDDSSDSDSDSHESSPNSHETNNDSDDSSDSGNGSHENNPDNHESNNDSDDNSNSDNGSHESSADSHESKNDSKESNNSNNGSNGSENDSKESNNSNNGSNGSENDSKESNNSNNGSNGSENDSKESNNSNSGSNRSTNDSKESKNNSNNSNSGSNENKNESGSENQINGNKGTADNNSESNNNDNKKIDDLGKDNEAKENDSKDTSKSFDGKNDESKTINENNVSITPDVSQSTESTAAVSKIEAVIQERIKQFGEAKEKYQEINRKKDNSTKLQRRKRDIDFSMPPPPVLQPLNVRMLPDFIQRMITNIPALKNVMSPDERGESNYIDENRPQNYGFHLNNDKSHLWNNVPFINQENYLNEPSNMINKEKQDEYQDNHSPDISNDLSNSGSDDNSLYSDNDSGYNAEPEDGAERSSDDNLTGGVWPNLGAPVIDFNNYNPYNPITKENDVSNFVNKINKDADIIEQHEPMIQPTTETNINFQQLENHYKSTKKEPMKAPTYTPPPKTKININKDLKEKIEMSFDNIGKMVPPMITRFEENLSKTVVNNNDPPLTYGMKLSGDHGYVWNNLADPGKHYLFGETLDTNKEWNEPSSPATDNFNEYYTEPTNADERTTEANKPTEPPFYETERTTQIVTETYIENQSQKPTTESDKLNEPNKESLDKDKDKSDDKKDNEAVQIALDDLLKKDEFWQWLTKWTAAYIEVLNEHVEELVKREVAKQVNKTMNQINEKEKDKIDTNNSDLINKNETIANVTTVEPSNSTSEINTNITTTEKSIPEVNITDENIAPEKYQINNNNTVSDGHKSNKTTPANAHTIYGNAIASDHVTNIFIFYPNAENNTTAKDIEAILGNKNNNVVVLGKPSNDNKESKASDSTTSSPVDETTGIYAIDQKKDIVTNASEATSPMPATTVGSQSSTTDLPNTAKYEDTTTNTDTDTSGTTEASTSSTTESNTNATTDAVSSDATESTSASNAEATTDTAATTTTVAPDTSTAAK